MARMPKGPIVAPELPPLTERELEAERRITAQLQALVVTLRQRNLDVAVLLAQQAAREQGPLVDHFCELGRRFVELLNEPPKPTLRLVN